MTAKQLIGSIAPDGSTYSTFTDGVGNLSSDPVLITGGLKQLRGNRSPDGSRYRVLTDGNGTIYTGGGGSYVAKAVHTDGTVILINEALSAAGLDNENYSASYWWKDISGVGGTGVITITDPDNSYVNGLDAQTNNPSYDFNSEDGSSGLLGGFYAEPFDSSWHHYLISVKTNASAGNKIATVYIDDVYDLGAAQDVNPSFTMVNNGKKVTVFDDGFSDGVVGDFADLWVAPGVSLLEGGSPALKILAANPSGAGPGPVTLLGAVAGQSVSGVFDYTSKVDVSSEFETVISVNDQIQQTGSSTLVNLGVSLPGGLTIPDATRRLFISATKKPMDPSGFPSAAMLFSGDSTTFPINQGTGGDFSLTGTLTNASTSPSN
jgi:hypothetical protein